MEHLNPMADRETINNELWRDREDTQGGSKGQYMEKIRLEMQRIEIRNKRSIKWRCWCGLELSCGFCSAK